MIKKNILKIFFLALILVSVTVAGSMFAGAESSNVALLQLDVPSGTFNQGAEFEVTVKMANTDVSALNIAGLQVFLEYDDEKLSTPTITEKLDNSISTSVYNSNLNPIRFVCVKNDVNTPYTNSELNNGLFSVTFTVTSNSFTPSAEFSKDNFAGIIVGDINAQEVTAESISSLAAALLQNGFEIKDFNSNNIVVITTNDDVSNIGEYTPNTLGNCSTGATVSKDGQTATVVVKGDLDGDGKITVFDAMILKKANDANGEGNDAFTYNRFAEEAAGDFDGDNQLSDDVENILKSIVNN